MNICWNANESKTWKAQRILSHLLLSFVLVSTIAGSVYVANREYTRSEIIRALKTFIGFPAWSTLSLLMNAVFGYLAVAKKKKLYLSIKLAFDCFQIVSRVSIIIFIGWLLLPVYGRWVRGRLPEDIPKGYNIDPVKLDFAMILIVFIMEISILANLITACVFYCRHDNDEENRNHGLVVYKTDVEQSDMNFAEKELL